jgi:nucleoside-diphosphate-sugar epimerase
MNGRQAVFVTGASGFIGRTLVARLLASGQRVTVLARDHTETFPDGVAIRVGDLTTGDGLSADLLDGADVLFHCAGEGRRTHLMRSVHVDGTRRLLEGLSRSAARRATPLHWVQLSSVGAYGPPPDAGRGRRVDEDSPENPVGDYETTKTESDRLVIQAASDGLMTHAILRPANVVGASMPNNYVRRLVDMVRRGWFFYIGASGAVTNYVHVEDVATGLLLCAGHPRATGQIFNISSDCPLEELVEVIARSLGVRVPRLRVPERLARSAVRTLGGLVALPLKASRIDALVNSTHYPSTKIETVLEFRFSMPMPAGIEDVMVGRA